MSAGREPIVDGSVSNGYERVRDAFVENFTHRESWGARVASTRTGRRSSISGVAYATGQLVSRGWRTRWSSFTLRRRGWLRW